MSQAAQGWANPTQGLEGWGKPCAGSRSLAKNFSYDDRGCYPAVTGLTSDTNPPIWAETRTTKMSEIRRHSVPAMQDAQKEWV